MVQIITDSSTLYTVGEAQAAGFESVPLCITIGNTEGRDLRIDMNTFYEEIRNGKVPVSSQPPIGDVVDLYEKYRDTDIINIAMADGLSGTYQSALSAREMVDNKDRITVFNTRTLCGPHRYMAETAQKLKMEGRSAEEILGWLRKKRECTESFLIPQDFAFLKRSGRLTPVAAAIGSALKLKPVMILTKDGKLLDKFLLKRTMSAAVKGIINYLKERELGAQHILYISHADAPEDADAIRIQFEKEFKDLEIRILELSPVFVAHGGPSCVAIQYIER